MHLPNCKMGMSLTVGDYHCTSRDIGSIVHIGRGCKSLLSGRSLPLATLPSHLFILLPSPSSLPPGLSYSMHYHHHHRILILLTPGPLSGVTSPFLGLSQG